MPIYEYECLACGHHFEVLIRTSKVAACPSCDSRDLEQLISLFQANSESTRQVALRSGRKQAARTHRDKVEAQREYERNHDH
jgi:putative FmdB family regulatory protein